MSVKLSEDHPIRVQRRSAIVRLSKIYPLIKPVYSIDIRMTDQVEFVKDVDKHTAITFLQSMITDIEADNF